MAYYKLLCSRSTVHTLRFSVCKSKKCANPCIYTPGPPSHVTPPHPKTSSYITANWISPLGYISWFMVDTIIIMIIFIVNHGKWVCLNYGLIPVRVFGGILHVHTTL